MDVCQNDTDVCHNDSNVCHNDTDVRHNNLNVCHNDTDVCRNDADTDACHNDTDASSHQAPLSTSRAEPVKALWQGGGLPDCRCGGCGKQRAVGTMCQQGIFVLLVLLGTFSAFLAFSFLPSPPRYHLFRLYRREG